MASLCVEAQEEMQEFPSFIERVGEYGTTEDRIATLQINVGLKCNLACKHCHVESSPARTEEMSRETMEQCLKVVRDHDISVIDITGGAPRDEPELRMAHPQRSSNGCTRHDALQPCHPTGA